jgi:predicted O-linked N-acetylglucosamine transferase (SPINDLY family)
LLCIQASASEKLQYARRYIAALPTFAKLWRGEVYSHDRIRVAYVSTDFHPHPVSYCMAGLFELHDKSRFETTAISLGPAENCELRYRLQCAFERFIDVRFERDLDIAELIQHLEIDILVDLNGHTGNSRPNIFSRRPAPIQVNYLGFMGTTGADYMDYIIADSTVVPEDQLEFYTEKVVWLPDSFMATDRCLLISETTPTRAESGLPELGFVFCCFNNTFKIMPVLFAIWMRLLRNTPDSVLWLIEVDPIASANLRTEAERHGIHSDRLIFSPRVNLAEHLARQKNADLFP